MILPTLTKILYHQLGHPNGTHHSTNREGKQRIRLKRRGPRETKMGNDDKRPKHDTITERRKKKPEKIPQK